MPRRETIFVPGEFYHVYNRGPQKAPLFFTPKHYFVFFNLMNRFSIENGVDVVAVCLMPNHFHLILMQQEGGSISNFMHKLCFTFSKRMNREYRRTGTSFEGRFKSKHCADTDYLKHLLAYIHANPATAGIVESAVEWEYSDFLEHTGARNTIKTKHHLVSHLFESVAHYANAVFDYTAKRKKAGLLLQADLADMTK